MIFSNFAQKFFHAINRGFKTVHFTKGIYSMRKSYILIMGIIAFTFAGIVLGISLYFTSTLRTRTFESIKDTMSLYNQTESQRLNDLETYLLEIASNNLNITILSTMQESTETYPYAARVKNTLDTSLPAFSDIEGLFLYFPDSDIFIPRRKNNDQITCSNYCKQLLRTARADESFESINTQNWFSVHLDETDYFLRIMKINNIYIGAWSSIRQLSSAFEQINELDAALFYVNDQGHVMSNEELDGYIFDPTASLKSHSVFQKSFGNKYLLVSCELDYCDYYLMAMIPWKNITQKLLPVYQMLLLFFFIIIFIIILIIYSMNGFLTQPILALQQAASSMRDGKSDTKISNDNTHCEELIIINNTFNNMIDEMYKLNSSIYEEQIAKKEIELQLLKSQIAPHFLINCLYTTYNLADDSANHEAVQKMVQTLSEHLRYTLSGKNTVSLKEEMKYVVNYIKLTELRFPGCLFYSSEIKEETENASVFPLIILALTENTIKHNMLMGETLTISIRADVYNDGNEKRIRLIHIDSGEGFPKETIEAVTEMINHPTLNMEGRSIGLYNIIRRLKLIFNESASISFSNESGSGARIDIDFPFIDYIPDHSSEEI